MAAPVLGCRTKRSGSTSFGLPYEVAGHVAYTLSAGFIGLIAFDVRNEVVMGYRATALFLIEFNFFRRVRTAAGAQPY